jgi:threonine synthase
MASHFIVECLDCGHKTPFVEGSVVCPNCKSNWREARYNYTSISHSLPLLLPGRPFDIWRYRELLPIRSPNPELSLGEGGTPLIHASNLGMMLGCSNIYIKDERQGPTASFKDRQAAITIASLKEAGITDCVLASTGNVALAYSAFAARAGIRLWAFLTSLVPAAKMREVALYGTQVIKITGTYDQAKVVAAEFAEQHGYFYESGAKSIPCVESMKTLAFECAEQLTAIFGPPSSSISAGIHPIWQSPDWYIQAVSGGLGPLGVMKGFDELKLLGFIDRVPKVACIQVEGCSPMVHAWLQHRDTATPIQSPRTLISTLATGDPGRTYTMLKQKMDRGSGGTFISATDEEAFRAMHFLAKMEGLSIEPAAAVAFAGMIKIIRDGTIKPDEIVVVNCSGHTMPIDRNILGEGVSQSITLPTQKIDESTEDGLLAALSNIAIDRFPRIAIVDDNQDVRLLIRRILRTQGKYTLFEATTGLQAIELAKKEKPNLLILDLMMPEMDGFAVMDALKADPDTADIPIIVLTAKELTQDEKQRLNGHIQALMQKGDFQSDDLVDEVRALLK